MLALSDALLSALSSMENLRVTESALWTIAERAGFQFNSADTRYHIYFI